MHHPLDKEMGTKVNPGLSGWPHLERL